MRDWRCCAATLCIWNYLAAQATNITSDGYGTSQGHLEKLQREYKDESIGVQCPSPNCLKIACNPDCLKLHQLRDGCGMQDEVGKAKRVQILAVSSHISQLQQPPVVPQPPLAPEEGAVMHKWKQKWFMTGSSRWWPPRWSPPRWSRLQILDYKFWWK